MAGQQRLPHSALGVEGYVQISSPIRRYGDLLAHYQLKAVLRGSKSKSKSGGAGTTTTTATTTEATTDTDLAAAAAAPPAPPVDGPTMSRWVDACHTRSVAMKAAQRDATLSWVARYLRHPARSGQRYPATVLSFLRRDLGLARVMLDDLQVEVLATLVAADVEVGDQVHCHCVLADPFQPLIRMEQVLS